MAYVDENSICRKCGSKFTAYNTHNSSQYLCVGCFKKEEDVKRSKFLKEWKGDLSLEQRIEKIENWIYSQENKPYTHPLDERF